ncbi:uncharacterized protein LOC144543518 [Centroberyx gerrardi]
MNITLLTAILLPLALVQVWQGVVNCSHGNNMTSSLVSPQYNRRPCEKSSNNNAFNQFVYRHFLKEDFDRKSKPAWTSYLKKKNLCRRTPLQTFIDKRQQESVLEICRSSGTRYEGNKCISTRRMPVYVVRVDTSSLSCTIKSLTKRSQYVTVACDAIENLCLPVHFEGGVQRPKPNAKSCSGIK